ncbi:MAG TPA: translation initiation factor IF-2 [Candidatus Omnitrophota bacterium]|nr:translation initiation factor IF-2 [Candidatus Omnitrophota bacterium]HQO38011.1 translation initiation factor IF-2 [Candidatus Omnitrophota bacterium]
MEKIKKAKTAEKPKMKKAVAEEKAHARTAKPAAKAKTAVRHTPAARTKEKTAAAAKIKKPAVVKKPAVRSAAEEKPLHAAVAPAPAAAVRAPAAEPAAQAPAHKPAVEIARKQAKKEPLAVPAAAANEPAAKTKAVGAAHKPAAAHKPVAAHQPAAAPEEVKPAPVVAAPARQLKELEIAYPITVKDLAIRLQIKSSVLIMELMARRVMAGLNQNVDPAVVASVAEKYGYRIVEAPTEEEAALSIHEEKDDPGDLKPRAPIVTIMGHVDHGKTSILDAIRKSKVADSEFGGITQHMGAYRVKLPQGEITFLDTPGHEAFTAMRARGASVTDIVVLVVAADDGVMPQTREAIDHAKAAGVSIIVALNKIDKPQAEPDRVKKQLGEFGLVPEDWGGKTITIPVSAKTGQGINELLEMILLEAQMLELKANPGRLGRGVVIESKLVKSRGPVSTLLVQNGTLHLNDNIIVGEFYGKIRAMFNDRGHAVTEVGPACPVEVLGITGVPDAGEKFFSIVDEKKAKDLVLARQEQAKQHAMQPIKRMGLEDLYAQIKEGKLKELNLVLKADAQGSAEAIKEALAKIPSDEVQLCILHEGIGNVTSSDVILAVASNALILGFNVVVDDAAKEAVAREGQDVRIYNVIYELVNDIRAALEGMLAPKLKKVFVGRVDIKKVFRLSSGTIAGCLVAKGMVNRHNPVSIVRNGRPVFEGELSSLKRFKDDVREVEEGYECGMTFKGFNEVMEGDVVEVYRIEKIARTLE